MSKNLDIYQAIIELKKQGYSSLDEALKDCENSDPKIINAENRFVNSRYGNSNLSWVKKSLNKTGIYKAIGGNATLLFNNLMDQASEGNCRVITSIKKLESETGLSKNTVKECLEKCKEYALLITLKESKGASPTVYQLNPELMYIGKISRKRESSAITQFYKATGTVYGFEKTTKGESVFVIQEMSEPHRRFCDVVNNFSNNHIRGIKPYVNSKGDVEYAGAFLNPDEVEKYKDAQKKASDESANTSDAEITEELPFK